MKDKLRDPLYLERHMVAVAVSRGLQKVPWYDAHFLKYYAVARKYLKEVAPHLLDDFVEGFVPLRTPHDFQAPRIEGLLDSETLEEIRAITRSIPEGNLENHEIADFGRHVVHDHPRFEKLQRDLQPRVEELLGRELVAGYNFLSLYGPQGVCNPHLDHPFSMYTLDLCIDQSGDWPIYFSKVIDWSDPDPVLSVPPAEVRDHEDLNFQPHVLRPNEALIFSGSGQWHYRNPISPGGFCNLLFLHYYPKGAEDLVRPHRWARHFGWAELEPLCDLLPADELNGEPDETVAS
ncbi:MAG: hypothetical protein WA957_16065 [Alteraurantiacibacter sp.]